MKPSALFLSLVFLCQSLAAQVASNVRVSSEDGGPVFATVDGAEKQIAPFGYKAWLLDEGRAVAYSARGSGGFENEGQTLYLYDAKSGLKHRLFSARFEITDVKRAQSAAGKIAYLVSMEDGGLGATHIAVIDPAHGQVFHQDGARFDGVAQGTFSVSWYKDEDWEKLRQHAEVAPTKSQRYDLDDLLKPKPPAHKTVGSL